MRQVLGSGKGVLVARMPCPVAGPGQVLVRVRYSLISAGTELAALRPEASGGRPQGMAQKAAAYSDLAFSYLGKAARDPRRAARRAAAVARAAFSRHLPRRSASLQPALGFADFQWTACGGASLGIDGGSMRLAGDASEFGYQAMSREIPVSQGLVVLLEIAGRVERGAFCLGALNENRDSWLGNYRIEAGDFQDSFVFLPGTSAKVTLVLANAGLKCESAVRIDSLRLYLAPAEEGGLPQSEMDDQGWNLGYSAAGEVVGLGTGISDLPVGGLVACAGAGYANHADFVAVPRNLACPVPAGCDLKLAATTTVGTIALQGVRRAGPELGETVGVVGLGLIGQITVGLLRASGCRVIGMDLNPVRVKRALQRGMDAGATAPAEMKQLVRDLTAGRGLDRILLTAATKSDAAVNLAMELARRRGVVVLVGDVGMNIGREHFYKKELDLRMSTSYGPGRYDRNYEERGQDYPHAYVPWTLNRNMAAYMDLISSGRLNVSDLIDRVVPVGEAPGAYASLAAGGEDAPLGVLLHFPDDERRPAGREAASRISIRGHARPVSGALRYALVGAGAFGTSMLVPAMQRRKDRFFLRGVVDTNTVAASNFARANRVEVLAAGIGEILEDPGFDLVVIATRHNSHAEQARAALEAGKHVFVEKPLALTWEELHALAECYERLENRPLLMVGFNRRFSPAMQVLEKTLEGRRSPLIVNYRLNGGYIPLESWIQGEEGGGRNLGEACHMYDVFRFLAGAPAASISATAINPGGLPYRRDDNFAATIGFEDGSVGNLVYTALGPKAGLAKERVEVFCDGEALVVDDYLRLTRSSDGKVLWEGETQDKGHFEELSRFGDAIARGGPPPIPWEELVETTGVSLRVQDLLFSREEPGA